MTFAISGLPVETFQPLFGLDDAALAAHGAVRVTAAEGRYPCRVTLQDAAPGETLLLVNYQDHDVATPYRSAYAIYVREQAADSGVHIVGEGELGADHHARGVEGSQRDRPVAQSRG